MASNLPALLVLADGTKFRGFSIGASGHTVGEVVFNTSMTGYQEIISDPSYAEQIISFTYPHIGNVGINEEDFESDQIYSKGITIVNSYAASDFDTKEALEKISNKQINVSQLITHKYNLQECQEAFVHAKSGDNAMKIIISN